MKPRLRAPYLIPWLLRLGAVRHPEMLWSLADRRTVCLTFDDGPGRPTAAVLEVLRQEGVPAAFFVLGNRCAAYPDLVKRIHAEGHTLGLHGMEHRSYTGLSSSELEADWERQRSQLLGLLGPGLRIQYCRPPFGHAGRRECHLAAAHGLRIAQMTCLPGTHLFCPPGWEETPALMAERAARELKPGGIITLHDGEDLGLRDAVHTQEQAAETARRVIKAVRQTGLDFGTLDG